MTADPKATMSRIIGAIEHDKSERMYRCHVCMDVGWIELPEGQNYMTEAGNKAVVRSGGPGAVQRCRGPKNSGCPYEQYRAEEARKKGAQSGKPVRGDEAAV